MSKRKGRAYCSRKNEQYEEVVCALMKISLIEYDLGTFGDLIKKDPRLIDSISMDFKLSNTAHVTALRNALNAYLGEDYA
jgi:predicted DNA-binding transcriptional regulator